MIKMHRELMSSSLILLITFNIYNFLNFIFHFFMARMLTAAEYGILATLFSIIYISGVFSEPIQTIVARYSASEKDSGKIKNLVTRTIRKALKISSLIFIAYIFISIPLTFLLKIPYVLLISTGLIIFSAFLQPITRGAMQGRKMFKSLGLNLIIETVTRLVLAIIFILIGWKVYGAMAAVIISTAIAFLFSFLAIRGILKSKEKTMPVQGIYSYSLPVFLIIFTILVFYGLDVIIAKIVFPEEIAGYYAIASVLAKTIFFGTQPISKAMFPISAEKKHSKGSHLLMNSLAIVILCIVAALIVLYFFPELIVRIFSGRYIPEASGILFYLGIAFGLLSITNLMLLYKLSSKKINGYWLFLIFPIIEAILLFIFSDNLLEFSLAVVTASAIFLWGSVFLLDD